MGVFKVYYQEGVFVGGSPKNSRWNEIDKSIVKLRVNIGCKHLTLTGYDAYNHIVEQVVGITREINSITMQMLLAKKGDEVERYIFDFKTGSFSYDVVSYGTEYNGKPVTGWKEGIVGTPTVITSESYEPFNHSPLD